MVDRYITNSAGIYPYVGGGGGGGTGGGGGAVYVGPLAESPDPLVYGTWIVAGNVGPWTAPIATGVFTLMVSNGTSWFPISGVGSAGGGSGVTEVYASTEAPGSTGAALVWVDTDSGGGAFLHTVGAAPLSAATMWVDTFDRPDAVGYKAVGNGWTPDLNLLGDLRIDDHMLRLQSDGYYGYQRFYTYMPTATPFTGDIAMEVDWPAANIDFGTGMMCRFDETTTRGVRCWLTGPDSVELGDATWWDADNVPLTVVAPFPASWGTADLNTLRLELRGEAASIYANGVLVRTGRIAVNTTIENGAVGLCGEAAGRVIDAIRVYSI